MAEVTYVPSTAADGWRAAVAADAIAVLSPAVTPQTADAVWRRLNGGGIGALVEALTGAFGTSLTAIPPFALVMVEGDDLRVAVRGPLEVVVEAEGGAASVSGRGVATWAERTFAHVHRATVVLGGRADETQALPLVSGVVPADGVVLTLTAPSAKSGASAGLASGDRAPVAPAPAAAAPDAVPAPDAAADIPASDAPASAAVPEASAAPDAPAPDASAPDAAPVALAPAAPAPDVAPDAPAPAAPTPDVAPDTPAPDAPAPDAAPGPGPGAPEAVASDTTMSAATTTNEPSGSDTWIPADPDLVDAVPLTGSSPADDSTIAAPRPSTASGAAWAATVARGDAPLAPATDAGARGDHDGATISVAEARALRGLPAVFEPVADVPPRQPARGRVRLSSGQVVELERPVVIGRRPRSTRASGAELPTLIAVESPEGDISRSHVEIRAEGEHVLVTDLATTNGTVLRRVGQDPVRLHPHEPTMVVTGDSLDLGDGVTVIFEDLP